MKLKIENVSKLYSLIEEGILEISDEVVCCSSLFYQTFV